MSHADWKRLEETLIAREMERGRALVDDDMVGFADLLTDDIVHVHATGIVHGKSELLAHAGGFLKFFAVTRGPLEIRPVGTAAAIMTGSMSNVVGRRDRDERATVDAFVTQVWVREADTWRIRGFHATRLEAR